MPKQCPRCGHINPDDAYFCEYCYYPLFSTTSSSARLPTFQPEEEKKEEISISPYELQGLYYLRRFSLFYVISMFLIGLGLGAITLEPIISSIMALFGVAIGVYSIILIRIGYSKLANVSSEFKSPMFGGILLIVGLVVMAIAEGLTFYIINTNPVLLNELQKYISTGSLPTTITPALMNLALVGLVALIAIVISVVGMSLSLVIGPFKLKKRYGGLFHIAGILFLLGFVLSSLGVINGDISFIGFLLTVVASLMFLNSLNYAIYKLRSQQNK